MAYIRIAYKTKNKDFDYVPGHRLDSLIAEDEITHFFRPAEKRWVSVKFDPVRGEGGDAYQGPERRRNDHLSWTSAKEALKSPFAEEASAKNWLERLWHHIENS
jgi:hypothetical protein